jgi:hypothetical protein
VSALVHPYRFGVGDANFSDIVNLSHFNGSDGSTTLTNSCGRGNNLTAIGTCAISTTQSVFGGSSLRVASGGNYAKNNHADYVWGTADFTFELRVRFDSVSPASNLIFVDTRNDSGGTAGWQLLLNSLNALYFFDGVSGNILSSNGALAANTWYAVAVCRASANTRLYLDGSQVGSTLPDTRNYLNGFITLGGASSGGASGITGYIDEVRATEGFARYTGASYTVATAEFPDF